MFKLASLFVEIKANDDALQKQVGGLKPQLTALGVAIGAAAGALAATAISKAAAALTSFLSNGISGASNLAETLSKVGTVFGDSASVVVGQADEMARAFGTSKQSILDASAQFGLIAKGAGMTGPAVADMSRDLAKLAADAASFHNVPLDVALEKIRAGLTGESEPLKAFGVLMNEDAVKAEAMRLGLSKTGKDLDEQSKVMARHNLIVRGLADAQGDLERTADSTSNQWRKLTGTMENMAVELGSALMPAINSLLNATTGFIEYARPGFEAVKDSFAAFGAFVVSTVETIGIVWRNLADEWEIVTVKAREMGMNLVGILEVIPTNLGIIADYIGNNWRELITDAVGAVGAVFRNLGTNIGNLAVAVYNFLTDPTKGFEFDWKPLLDGFTATAAAFPELAKPGLVSLQEEIDAVAGRIADRETKRAAALAAKAKDAAKPGNAVAAAAGKKAAEFKSETSGVSEFALKLRASIYDQGKDDVPKRQLEEQKKTTENTKKIADGLAKGLVARVG